MSFSHSSPRGYSDRIHMETVSTLRQKFPVDTSKEEIIFYVDLDLPDSIGTALLVQESTKLTSSVVEGGGIRLFPTAADTRLSRSNQPAERDLCKAHEVFRGLTEYQRLSLAHFEVTSENGFHTDFQIAFINQFGNGKNVYELSGTSEDGPLGEHNTYYLTTHEAGASQPGSYFEIDEELAGLILDALLSQQQQPVSPQPGSLQAKLQQVIDASEVRGEESAGRYFLPENDEISIVLERREVITRGIGKVATYSIHIEEQAETLIEGTRYKTPRGLSLDYDETATPQYEAYIHAAVLDPASQVPQHARNRIFDELAATYRARPEEFFRTLSHAAMLLAKV